MSSPQIELYDISLAHHVFETLKDIFKSTDYDCHNKIIFGLLSKTCSSLKKLYNLHFSDFSNCYDKNRCEFCRKIVYRYVDNILMQVAVDVPLTRTK